jgi:hypothetical protein
MKQKYLAAVLFFDECYEPEKQCGKPEKNA